MKAICPATLDVLLKILVSAATSVLPDSAASGNVGGDDVRQNKALLHDLVLKCMVRTVHVVHCCSPDQVCVKEALKQLIRTCLTKKGVG